MSHSRLLSDRLPELLRSIAGSTQDDATKAAWTDHMTTSLESALGRADSAAAARSARSERLRAAIRLAVQAIPPSVTDRLRVRAVRRRLARNPKAYGIAEAPCLATIRRTLAELETSVPK